MQEKSTLSAPKRDGTFYCIAKMITRGSSRYHTGPADADEKLDKKLLAK